LSFFISVSCQIPCILKQEVRAERQEARLHNKAVRAAMHGNVGRAISLEMQSNAAHHRYVRLLFKQYYVMPNILDK